MDSEDREESGEREMEDMKQRAMGQTGTQAYCSPAILHMVKFSHPS